MVFNRLFHAWRWLGTAFSFLVFGLGGILLPVFVVPALYVLPGDRLVRERRAQKVIHHSFRFYIGMMKFLGVLNYDVIGLEKLKDAKLILANHPSLIDVIFLISMVPNANCVVKGKLARSLFTKGPIRAAGYIINDDQALDVIDAAKEAFDKGHALIVFPEGTRTTPGQLPVLKRGAANVAVRAEADITPVIIECNPTTLTKSDRWYQVPSKQVRFRIEIKDCIGVENYLPDSNPSKSARRLTRDLSNYFNKELGFNE